MQLGRGAGPRAVFAEMSVAGGVRVEVRLRGGLGRADDLLDAVAGVRRNDRLEPGHIFFSFF